MAIDLGSEYVRAVLVKPSGRGNPLQIVVNEMSRRKSPALVGVAGEDRLLGEEASSFAIRYPTTVFSRARDLLGRSAGDAWVQNLLASEALPYELVDHPERKSVMARVNSTSAFLAEELVVSGRGAPRAARAALRRSRTGWPPTGTAPGPPKRTHWAAWRARAAGGAMRGGRTPRQLRAAAANQLGPAPAPQAGILQYAKQITDAQAGAPIVDAVITVPAWFGIAQRQVGAPFRPPHLSVRAAASRAMAGAATCSRAKCAQAVLTMRQGPSTDPAQHREAQPESHPACATNGSPRATRTQPPARPAGPEGRRLPGGPQRARAGQQPLRRGAAVWH
jgi:hypoxia up-regulated 1